MNPALPNLDARDHAIAVLRDVLVRRLALDDVMEKVSGQASFAVLSPADQGLARAIAGAGMRGLGFIRRLLADRLRDGLPPGGGLLEPVLVAGAAQILFLDVPDHAAVHTSIEKLKADRQGGRYAGLANAVLRAIAKEGRAALDRLDPLADNTPGWLAERWTRAYGEEAARAIARAHLEEPPLDLSVREEAGGWAGRLGGIALPTGTVRLQSPGPVPALAGFAEGAWWVQDIAAAQPARLLDAGPGMRVLDLCAAPGGKTAQLAATGALVTAVDRSGPRMRRLEQNLNRLSLSARAMVTDGLDFREEPFDRVLLDAPCSATGTIRRHPDVAWNKTLADVAMLSDLQRRLIDHAFGLVAPGGRLVYATCSLEPEEGEQQIAAFLARRSDAQLVAVIPDQVDGCTEWIRPPGFLRCLPAHLSGRGGCDGFFAAVLQRAQA
jgi:16S rRNA (cytosine967-C5)-methyltransferase